MTYQESIDHLRDRHPDLAGELAGFDSLEDVLGWLKDRGCDVAAIDIVAQDEYCHDVIVPLDDVFLVFGST